MVCAEQRIIRDRSSNNTNCYEVLHSCTSVDRRGAIEVLMSGGRESRRLHLKVVCLCPNFQTPMGSPSSKYIKGDLMPDITSFAGI